MLLKGRGRRGDERRTTKDSPLAEVTLAAGGVEPGNTDTVSQLYGNKAIIHGERERGESDKGAEVGGYHEAQSERRSF